MLETLQKSLVAHHILGPQNPSPKQQQVFVEFLELLKNGEILQTLNSLKSSVEKSLPPAFVSKFNGMIESSR
jgi:hypothetical protein